MQARRIFQTIRRTGLLGLGLVTRSPQDKKDAVLALKRTCLIWSVHLSTQLQPIFAFDRSPLFRTKRKIWLSGSLKDAVPARSILSIQIYLHTPSHLFTCNCSSQSKLCVPAFYFFTLNVGGVRRSSILVFGGFPRVARRYSSTWLYYGHLCML